MLDVGADWDIECKVVRSMWKLESYKKRCHVLWIEWVDGVTNHIDSVSCRRRENVAYVSVD